jgi:hypothetical protein
MLQETILRLNGLDNLSDPIIAVIVFEGFADQNKGKEMIPIKNLNKK